MAKLIKILAASVGGGIALGACIRLGEAIAGLNPSVAPALDKHASEQLLDRIGELENRLRNLESGSPASTADSSLESQINAENQRLDALAEATTRLRSDLKEWLEQNISAKITEVEVRLRAESESGRGEMLDALVDGVQTRVAQRISKLEDEVANQSTALTELRNCSLRTEQSVQQLLGGIDRLITRQSGGNPRGETEKPLETPAKPPEEAPNETTPGAIPVLPRSGSSRWKIFG